MARRKKKVEEQMDIFEEGGLKDEGGTVDPVSGNDVPSGSTQSEVRDDIPAQLSEGEFVFPADVVRYIGLENLMELRQKAKMGLQKMEDMGQMGNSEEATINDDVAFEDTIDKTIEAIPMAMGGAVPSPIKKQRTPFKRPVQNFEIGGTPQVGNPLTSTQTTPVATQPITLPKFSSFVQQPAMQQVQGLQPVVESKEFIGPNGERVTIQFVNGQPATPVPDGYREMTAKEKEEAMKPKIEQPKVQRGDNRPEEDTRTQLEKDLQRTEPKTRDVAQDVIDNIEDLEAKSKVQAQLDKLNKAVKAAYAAPFAMAVPGFGTAIAGTLVRNAVKEDDALDNLIKDVTGLSTRQYRNEQAVRAADEGLDDVVRDKMETQFGSGYLDRDELDALSSKSEKDRIDAFNDIVNAANRSDLAINRDDSSDTPSGPSGGSTASEDPSEEGSTGVGGDQASADAAGGSSTSSPFSKGGAVKPKRKRGLGRLK